jgi:O-antigen/teichoic acid export membrane protein
MRMIEKATLVEDVFENANPKSLIDGGSLARNTALNFAGQVLPLVAGIALIPYTVRGLGADRFGLLGIVWVVFGYFSLMDLGLGRATTKFLAEWLARGEAGRVTEMVWNSIILQVLLGLCGCIILAAITPLLVGRVLKTPLSLRGEGRLAFYVLAAALPVVLATNGLRAVLEGCQRFDISNLLRIPSTVLAFVIPAVGVAWGLRLPGIVMWLAISRLAFVFAHALYCIRILPCLKTRPAHCLDSIFPLLSFGGWVTASNLVNPILLSMDRLLIGALLSVAMVGYYTAPFEAVTKLWMVPASLMTAVYPACSALGADHINDLEIIYSRSIKYIFCALAPVSLILVLFARPIVGMWLGPGFVEKSAVPLQLLTVGVFINCFAHVPYCFLQALGRPDSAAKLFLLELIPYGAFAWWMIKHYGMAGAAAATAIRMLIEVLLLIWITWRIFSLSATRALDRRMLMGLLALCVMGLGVSITNYFLQNSVLLNASICGLWIAGFSLVVWHWVLDYADRSSVWGVLSPLRGLLIKNVASGEAGGDN